MTKLTVKKEISAAFTDVSNDAEDYLRDSFSATMVDTTDYIYVGHTKPFNSVYVEMETVNTNLSVMSVEVHDGTNWVSVANQDQSRALNRSGFISWEKALMSSILIDGDSSYYMRMSVSVTTSAMAIRGINLVLSDDQDLKQEFFEIDQLLTNGQVSHIAKHVAARNDIIQELRNDGNVKVSAEETSDIDVFDLHSAVELRRAATYLALAKVFFNLSDSVEDNWFIKFREYTEKHKTMMSMYRVSIDINDNGLDDETPAEKKKKPFIWSR